LASNPPNPKPQNHRPGKVKALSYNERPRRGGIDGRIVVGLRSGVRVVGPPSGGGIIVSIRLSRSGIVIIRLSRSGIVIIRLSRSGIIIVRLLRRLEFVIVRRMVVVQMLDFPVLRVEGDGLRVWGIGEGLVFTIRSSELGVWVAEGQGLGVSVQGPGFRVQGLASKGKGSCFGLDRSPFPIQQDTPPSSISSWIFGAPGGATESDFFIDNLLV